MKSKNFFRNLGRVLPVALALSVANPTPSFSYIRDKRELPDGYSFAVDKKTGEDIDFRISYSGEEFRVRLIEKEKRGLGRWSPWLIEGQRDGVSYVIGKKDYPPERLYGMSKELFYSRIGMAATVAHFDYLVQDYPQTLRGMAQEFRAAATGEIYRRVGGEVYDLAGIGGGIVISRAVIKANPGALALATKEIAKEIRKTFMNRATLPDDPKEGLNTVNNVATIIKNRLIGENNRKLKVYADNLEGCARILETHDIIPNNSIEDWDYKAADRFYELFRDAQINGVALESFVLRLRKKETQINALAKRLLSKIMEGGIGVSIEDIVQTKDNVEEIFTYKPVRQASDDATKIAYRLETRFRMHFESRFDIATGRRTDATVFLNENWPYEGSEVPQEIEPLEEKVDKREPPIATRQEGFKPELRGELERIVQEKSETTKSTRPQNEPLVARRVYVNTFEPTNIEAGDTMTFKFHVKNENEFDIQDVYIYVDHIVYVNTNSSGKGFHLQATREVEGSWGVGQATIARHIPVLHPDEEGIIKFDGHARNDALLGDYKIIYIINFEAEGIPKSTKERDDLTVRVYEEP